MMKITFKPEYLNMGVREFARFAGVSPTTVTRLRNNAQTIDAKTLEKIKPYLAHCPFCQKENE